MESFTITIELTFDVVASSKEVAWEKGVNEAGQLIEKLEREGNADVWCEVTDVTLTSEYDGYEK